MVSRTFKEISLVLLESRWVAGRLQSMCWQARLLLSRMSSMHVAVSDVEYK